MGTARRVRLVDEVAHDRELDACIEHRDQRPRGDAPCARGGHRRNLISARLISLSVNAHPLRRYDAGQIETAHRWLGCDQRPCLVLAHMLGKDAAAHCARLTDVAH